MGSQVIMTVLLAALSAGGLRADRIPLGPSSQTPRHDLLQRLDRCVPELDAALTSFGRGEWAGCLDQLRLAQHRLAELPPAELMLARLLMDADRLREARAVLEQAVAASREHPEGYLLFGYLAYIEGRLSDAQVHFEKALGLVEAVSLSDAAQRSYRIRGHAGLAYVAELRGDWAAARDELVTWLELDPKNSRAQQQLGRAQFATGDPDHAFENLQQAAMADPSLEPAAVSMGWLFARKGDPAKAAVWMDYAVTNAPSDFRAYLGRATWLLEQDRLDDAQAAADDAARLQPQDHEVIRLRGLIAWARRDCAEAEQHFEALHRDRPADFAASNQLALALAEQGDAAKLRRAVQLAEVNAKANPAQREAVATLGRAYYRLGRLDDAERALRASLVGGAADSETAYMLARVLADRGQAETAVALVEAALAAPGWFPLRSEARAWLAKQRSASPPSSNAQSPRSVPESTAPSDPTATAGTHNR